MNDLAGETGLLAGLGAVRAQRYCWGCKQYREMLNWSIDWSLSPRGIMRPYVRFACPKGHPNTSYITPWAAPPLIPQPGPLYWSEIPWRSLRMAAEVARHVTHHYLDGHERMMQELHGADFPPWAIAELFQAKPQTVYKAIGTRKRKSAK